MTYQTALACPVPTLKRHLFVVEEYRLRRQRPPFKVASLPTALRLALSQVHKTEGQGTYSDLTPEKVQRLVRTCGAYPIAKMLAKRGVPCRVARQLMGV